MSAPEKAKLVTAEELLRLPDDGLRYELFRGTLRKMAPAGEAHGSFAMRLGWRLARFAEEQSLGAVYAAETGFRLTTNPDTVRAPDIAFVSRRKLEQTPPTPGYRQGPPDLAALVVSPDDRPGGVAETVYEWLFYGAQEVWVLEPEARKLTVYHPGEPLRAFGPEDTLSSPLFPGFELSVGELFAS